MPTAKVFLALGSLAWTQIYSTLLEMGEVLPKPRPKFGHGESFTFIGRDGVKRLVIGSYHPSQQNTFTGKLTEKMLDHVIAKAKKLL
jgi:uracil-DNA glycosylase